MAMTTYHQRSILKIPKPEAESQEKHDAWDLRLDWTITSPYVDSRVDSIICNMGTGQPLPESTSNLLGDKVDLAWGCRTGLESPDGSNIRGLSCENLVLKNVF
jgi:hypothetical protein